MARILFIDDYEVIRESTELRFEILGHQATICASGEEAVAVFSQDPFGFDLVITDMEMPGMTGFDVLKKLRAIRPDLPVVLATGRFLGMGFTAVLQKPYPMEELRATIERVLSPQP